MSTSSSPGLGHRPVAGMDELPSVLLLHKTVVVPNPGSNAEWSFTVPVGKKWLLKSVVAQLVQGNTQTPQPVLVLDDGTNVFAEGVGAVAAQGANTTVAYCWAPAMVLSGIQGTAADQHAQAPLMGGEETFLLPGWRIRTHTIGLGANSTWQNIVLYVAEDG